MIATIFFYIFAVILLASAATVVSARNPVHSVLFLILAFFNAAALFLIAGAEFLAMVLVIVYVGAVAVLFLFVVMMLDVNFAELRSGFQRYLPVGAAVGAVLFVELLMVAWRLANHARRGCAAPVAGAGDQQHPGARQRALHRLHLPVPGGRPGAAGGDDRRHRADAARPQDVTPPEHCRMQTSRTVAETLELVDVAHRRRREGAGHLPSEAAATHAGTRARRCRRQHGHGAEHASEVD